MSDTPAIRAMGGKFLGIDHHRYAIEEVKAILGNAERIALVIAEYEKEIAERKGKISRILDFAESIGVKLGSIEFNFEQ